LRRSNICLFIIGYDLLILIRSSFISIILNLLLNLAIAANVSVMVLMAVLACWRISARDYNMRGGKTAL